MKDVHKREGLPPGSVIFSGHRKVEKINIHYLEYNESEINEQTVDNQTITDFHQPDERYIQWYDIRGLHDTILIEEMGRLFDVHPLVLEDVAGLELRPKFEEYDNGNFVTIVALRFDKKSCEVQKEQVALYFGDGFVLTFQERDEDLFHKVKQRLQAGYGKVRKRKADYLTYALLDAVTDRYYIVFDEIREAIDDLEAEVLSGANENVKSKIHGLKQELIAVRKAISPLREAVNRFAKSDSTLIDENTRLFLRDLYDHTIQVMDMLESFRDVLNSLQDLYLSEISYKMNQVMQVLTIITSVFVPLSFLTGLYGMNFKNMPELETQYGYFVLLGVMFLIFVGSMFYFKKKRWF